MSQEEPRGASGGRDERYRLTQQRKEEDETVGLEGLAETEIEIEIVDVYRQSLISSDPLMEWPKVDECAAASTTAVWVVSGLILVSRPRLIVSPIGRTDSSS